MILRVNFTGGRGGMSRDDLLWGLRHGRPSAYFLTLGMIALCAVAIWAGRNLGKQS